MIPRTHKVSYELQSSLPLPSPPMKKPKVSLQSVEGRYCSQVLTPRVSQSAPTPQVQASWTISFLRKWVSLMVLAYQQKKQKEGVHPP